MNENAKNYLITLSSVHMQNFYKLVVSQKGQIYVMLCFSTIFSQLSQNCWKAQIKNTKPALLSTTNHEIGLFVRCELFCVWFSKLESVLLMFSQKCLLQNFLMRPNIQSLLQLVVLFIYYYYFFEIANLSHQAITV